MSDDLKISIYILTHKKFDYEPQEIYFPLLNGSALLNNDFGYLRDDNGDNISKLNPYFAELTGEYWAWKNSKCDILGFCHYRRYFAKNIFLKKLNKTDIEKILKKSDIILPKKRRLSRKNIDEIEYCSHKIATAHKKEQYPLLRLIIEKECPDYLDSFDEILNQKEMYYCNMFICEKKLADEYFTWLFNILNIFKENYDFSIHEKGNQRVLGYLSETLLNVYVKKHDLRVTETYLLETEVKIPLFTLLANRFTVFQKLSKIILKQDN